MSTSSGSLVLFFSHNSTDIIAITAIMRINNDTVTPKITFLYNMPLFLPPSRTSPHISPDTSEATQDKEGVGIRVAGVEETTTSGGGGGILGDGTGVGASVDVNIVVAALVCYTDTTMYDGMVGM